MDDDAGANQNGVADGNLVKGRIRPGAAGAEQHGLALVFQCLGLRCKRRVDHVAKGHGLDLGGLNGPLGDIFQGAVRNGGNQAQNIGGGFGWLLFAGAGLGIFAFSRVLAAAGARVLVSIRILALVFPGRLCLRRIRVFHSDSTQGCVAGAGLAAGLGQHGGVCIGNLGVHAGDNAAAIGVENAVLGEPDQTSHLVFQFCPAV